MTMTNISLPFCISQGKSINAHDAAKDVYKKLKEVPDRALAASGYSDVNLAKLFQAFASLK